MINRLIILCVSFTCVLGCSTGPDFKRDNKNDLFSNIFEPDVGNLVVSIDTSKNVLLNWADLSDFEDGFIIQKSYKENEFFDLDTVESNITSYIDKSKSLTTSTYYRIRSFSNHSDSLGTTEIDKLLFNPLKKLTVPDVRGNVMTINFEKEESGYFDFYLIEKKDELGSWSILDTLKNNVSNYSFTENEYVYFNSIRVSPLLLNIENTLEVIETREVENVGINLPSNFNVDLENEAFAKFSWTDNSIFEDGFIILQKTESTNSYSVLDTVFNANNVNLFINYSPDASYDFSLIPIFNDRTGKNLNIVNKKIYSIPPDNFKVQHVSDSVAEIYWRENNFSRPRYGHYSTFSYQLELLYDYIPYQTYNQINSEYKSFQISNLDPKKEYQFRMRTYSSYYSEIKNFKTYLSLTKTFQTNFQYIEAFEVDKKNHSFYVVRSVSPRKLQVYQKDYTTTESFSISRGTILDIKSSNGGNLISINHLFNKDSKIYIYDFSMVEPLIDSLKYSEEETRILSFESDKILTISNFKSTERTGNILKWNIETRALDTLYSYKCFCRVENMARSLFHDKEKQEYFLGLDSKLVQLDSQRNLIDEVSLPGTPYKIIKQNNGLYLKLMDRSLLYFNLETKEYRTIYTGYNVSDFIIIKPLNYLIVADYSSSTTFTFYDLETHEYIFEVNRKNKIYGLLYDEAQNSLNTISNAGIEVFDFSNNWEMKN